MVAVVYWPAVYRRASGSGRLAWSKGQQRPVTQCRFLHSSCELAELLQYSLSQDDNSINIIIITIIIT